MTDTAELEQAALEDMQAIGSLPAQIMSAWGAEDARRFAEVFTPDGTMVLPGVPPQSGRTAIEQFMTSAFAGPYRGTQVVGEAVEMHFASPTVAIVITKGGVRGKDESAVAPDRMVTATWVAAKDGSDWRLSAYHNSPAG